MPKFRKKPVVIEAFQLTFESRWNNVDWPQWLHDAWNKTHNDLPVAGSVYPDQTYNPAGYSNYLLIQTLEGTHRADINDWIIKGVKGELYPCKPQIFELTYEAASNGE